MQREKRKTPVKTCPQTAVGVGNEFGSRRTLKLLCDTVQYGSQLHQYVNLKRKLGLLKKVNGMVTNVLRLRTDN